MTRALAILLSLATLSSAAFLGSNPQRKITSTAASASDTLLSGGQQVLLTVTGVSGASGAFVTMATAFPCTAKRDTASAANVSIFVVKGVPVVRARPSGAVCIAATTADSGQSATLRFETGSGAP